MRRVLYLLGVVAFVLSFLALAFAVAGPGEGLVP